MRVSAVSEKAYRAFWSAVVLRAYEDIKDAPINSVTYQQAVSFCFGHGEWGESRSLIAACIDLHPDDLARGARAAIETRTERPVPHKAVTPIRPVASLPPLGWLLPAERERPPVFITPGKRKRYVPGTNPFAARTAEG